MKTAHLSTVLGALATALIFVGQCRASATQASSADEHTVALWLFDDSAYPNVILTDAGPHQHDLRLQGGFAKWWLKTEGEGTPDEEPLHADGKFGLVKGKFGGGLRLPAGKLGKVKWPDNLQRYGTEYLLDRGNQVPEQFNIGYLDWTLEFWHKAAGNQPQRASILEWRNETGHKKVPTMVNALMLEAGRSHFILFSKITEDDPERRFHLELVIPSDCDRLNDGKWHHLTFTYTAAERQMRYYVDGQLQPLPQKGGFLPMMGRLVSLTIGNELNATLDEMRLSDIVRYTDNFAPPGSLSRNYGANPPKTGKANGPPLLFSPEMASADVVRLGPRKHLFIDDALIEKMQDVKLTVNPPTSYQVTGFRNDKPWEPTPRMGSTIPDFCSFWDEGNEIRMLYTNSGMWGGKPHAVCYATSTDGINWEKPELGLRGWGRSTKNNIVLRNACQGSVIKDPNPQTCPDERYKYAAWCMYWGYYVFTSPDGINWRRNETVALPFDPDGSISFYWDDQRGMYQGYIRAMFDKGVRRRIAQVEMPHMLTPWPFKKIYRPNLGDMVLAKPISGELPLIDTGGQVYRFKAHKYAWAPDVYLAFPWRYIAEKNVRPGSFLMVSRDGRHWKRYEPPYYFASGWKLNGREVLEALMEHGMMRRGDEIWQFGTVRFTEHGGVLYGGVEHEGGTHDRLLRLVQRLDGFVSLDAGPTTGTVVTKPLVFKGDTLLLNISAEGSARVGLLDEDGRAVRGIAVQDCDPVNTDSVCHVVTWESKSDVSSAAGKVIKLKFELKNAKLYALQFVTGDKP